VSVAFAVAPALLGVGEVLPLEVLLALAVGQYLLKLAIAILDTPVVYAVVALVRSRRTTEQDDSERPERGPTNEKV
jgi:queuosine precursor transporter